MEPEADKTERVRTRILGKGKRGKRKRFDAGYDITGVEFNDAWKKKVRGKYGNVEVNFISKTDLIKNKTSTPRLQDKADAEELSENL
jgi:hypothetical protein